MASSSHPHVTALQAKKTALLNHMEQLNEDIKKMEEELELVAKKKESKLEPNKRKKKKVKSTRGFGPRNALLHELRSRVTKGKRHRVRPTQELLMWKDLHIKNTIALEISPLHFANDGSAKHDVVKIYAGSKNEASFCIPMNASTYTFRQLTHDLNELWDLPVDSLQPHFQLVANADPFKENEYDFVPQRFHPEALVREELLDLQQDPERGYGTQAGVPGSGLPALHCRPIVSGNPIDSLVQAGPTEQLHYFKALISGGGGEGEGEGREDGFPNDVDNDQAGTKEQHSLRDVQSHSEKGGFSQSAAHSSSASSSLQTNNNSGMTRAQYEDIFLARLAEGKDHEDTETIYKDGRELFEKWCSHSTDDMGVSHSIITFDSFTWLIEQWDDLIKQQRRLHAGLSARKAWKLFDKPSRFVGAGSTTVRFDEFAAAIRLHDKEITTKKLQLLFDKMDSDRGGSVGFDEFLAFWQTLKLDLFPDDSPIDSMTELHRLQTQASEKLEFSLPIIAYCKQFFSKKSEKDQEATIKRRNGSGSGARDLFLYSTFYFVFCLTVLWKRAVLPQFYMTSALQEKLEWNGKFGELSHMTYSKVLCRDDLWDWLEGPVSEVFINSAGTSYTRSLERVSEVDKVRGISDRIVGNNELVPSVLRLRQLRVKSQPCTELVTARSNISLCYPNYQASTRSSGAISSSDGTPFVKGETWVDGLSEDSSFSRLAARTGRGIVSGIHDYDASGYVVDLVTNASEWKSTLTSLRNSQWLDREHTRALIVQFVVYNPTLNAFLQADFLAEFFPAGGVSVHSSFRPMVLDLYSTVGERVLLVIEILICVWALCKLLHIVTVLLKSCWRSCSRCLGGCRMCRCCRKEEERSIFKNSTNTKDIEMTEGTSTKYARVVAERQEGRHGGHHGERNGGRHRGHGKPQKEEEEMITIKKLSVCATVLDITLCAVIIGAGAARGALFSSSLRSLIIEKVGTHLPEFHDQSSAAWLSDFGYSCDGFIALLLPLKIISKLKLLPHCGRTKLFIEVLTLTAENSFAIFVLYGTIVSIYANLGHFLFAESLYSYTNYPSTAITLVWLSVGQFDYEALDSVNSIAAFLFFSTFLITVVMITTKLFTAVINYEYGRLAEEARDDE